MTTNDYAEPAADLLNGRMSLLGFGTWQISNSAATHVTAHALEAGYRHIDTATMYYNEAGIGKALASSTLPRESIFVTTKLPPDRAGRERRTIEESLAKLGVDYVDLWLIHWPPNGRAAPRVWEQFIKARQDGLARAIRGEQLLTSTDRSTDRGDRSGAGGQPDPVGTVDLRSGRGFWAATARSRAGGVQPVQGEQSERPDLGLDRSPA
jgi:Aldo/keto reductase family